MAKKISKPRTKRLPVRLGRINTAVIADRLRELHRLGRDPEFERFPASEELFLVLQHAARTASELKQPEDVPVNVVGEAAVLRAKLWQHLREQADAGQLKAVEQGRAAGVPWHHFNEALCVTSKQGAYQKARRLKAEQVREPDERRSPETARKHEDRTLAEERAERARVVAQERRFPLALRIGRMLVEHQDGFVVTTMSEYWLSEITDTIDHRETALERANFSTFIEGFVREIHQLARERKQPATTTDEARRALMLATEFTYQAQPEIPEQPSGSQTGDPMPHQRRRPHRRRPAQ
ncbi:hypothetical protein OHB49_44905 (plasmid) [Streptomyces sp. NBC_01717]|uniref:hypothetical protein n=1 Tax=Streptomyces sp. NBC_01717 TaxID=2975918 RepID=UPI002E328B40|nr:hypothetical protein [Streptomyces sp. NBC_01717]